MLTKKEQLYKNKGPKEKDLLDQAITIRLLKDQIKQRVQWILDKQICQVCENSTDLDYPHHALDGVSRKDDRTLINICVSCHRAIHTKGFAPIKKTRQEVELIGWTNNKEFLDETNRIRTSQSSN